MALYDPRRQRLIQLLLSYDLATAARRAGVSRATAYRWAKEPDFIEEHRQARRVYLGELASSLARSDAKELAALAG